MSKLLFELLPSDVLMDKSKNFLNKSIWYHANEIKNSNNKLFSNEIKKIIELSSKNEISDTPFSWYALNTVKYLRSKELNDSDNHDLTRNILNQSFNDKENVLGIKYLTLSDINKKISEIKIPHNLVDVLQVDYDSWKVFKSEESYIEWADNFKKAVDLVDSVDNQSLTTIGMIIKYMLVLQSQGDSHGSMSPQNVTGTIFLPDTKDYTLIAECLVHEGLHNYLYRLEHCQPIFSKNEGVVEKYYSPWKDFARPLTMLIHGAFVFTGVIIFYNDLIKRNIIDGYGDTFEDRIVYRLKQVYLAIDVLEKNNHLTDFGKSILLLMKDSLDEIKNDYEGFKLPNDDVENHFNKFSDKNFLFK